MIFNKQLLQNIIERSEQEGIRKATGDLIKNLGIHPITLKGGLPDGGPLLIISNHPGVFDSLILLNQIERKDFYFIALSTYGIFGSRIQEKLLPIYRARRLNHNIYEYPLCLQITGRVPENLPSFAIRKRNRETIQKAAELINKGHAVSMFPSGSAGKRMKSSQWKAGIGFLVKCIVNPQTKVVFVQLKGTRKMDLFAFMHPIIKKLLFIPRPISVQFSKAEYLNQLVDLKNDAKSIVKTLELKYRKSF